jgi:hypothetical protein
MPNNNHHRTEALVLPRWPFWIASGLLVCVAIALAWQQGGPLTAPQMWAVVLAVLFGNCFAVTPYLATLFRPSSSRTSGGAELADLKQHLYKLEFRIAELAEAQEEAPAVDIKKQFEALRQQKQSALMAEPDALQKNSSPTQDPPAENLKVKTISEEAPVTNTPTQKAAAPAPSSAAAQFPMPAAFEAFLGASKPVTPADNKATSDPAACTEPQSPPVPAPPTAEAEHAEAPAADEQPNPLRERLKKSSSVEDLLGIRPAGTQEGFEKPQQESTHRASAPTSTHHTEGKSGLLKRALTTDQPTKRSARVQGMIRNGASKPTQK